MKKIPVLLLALMFLQPVFSHYKARYHVIIDTDGGVDDFRAICMMLASPEIEVIAITTVDGVLTAELTASKVTTLLEHFGHEGIPVGAGLPNPEYSSEPGTVSKMAGALEWAGGKSTADTRSSAALESPASGGIQSGALALILESIDLEEMPVDFVALGPLTNLAAVLNDCPETAGRIRRVYWNNHQGELEDFNHAGDPQAAKDVLKSGLNIDFISAGTSTLGSPLQLIRSLDTISSRYLSAMRDFYAGAPDGFDGHYMATHPSDDCIPLYMLYPENFTVSVSEKGSSPGEPERNDVQLKTNADPASLIIEALKSDREDKSIIFSRFPVDPGLLREDVATIAGEIIKRHGLKEWKIVVLTNEFHEHLGIYSILGAKMGLRAREYFNVGIDELTIVSYAGSIPPVSCLNDGLQVSTGATLGHGTISLAADVNFPGKGQFIPKARFTFKNQIIELSIKTEIRDKIREDVSRGVKAYGLESPEYWTYIRELALRYWLELSRDDIFEIERIINPQKKAESF